MSPDCKARRSLAFNPQSTSPPPLSSPETVVEEGILHFPDDEWAVPASSRKCLRKRLSCRITTITTLCPDVQTFACQLGMSPLETGCM
jgi:hypothetical protein